MKTFHGSLATGCMLFALPGLCVASNRDAAVDTTTVYIVRHAEKPSDGRDELTEQGKERADEFCGG